MCPGGSFAGPESPLTAIQMQWFFFTVWNSFVITVGVGEAFLLIKQSRLFVFTKAKILRCLSLSLHIHYKHLLCAAGSVIKLMFTMDWIEMV